MDKKKSTAASSGATSAEQASAHSIDAVRRRRIKNIQMVQNVLLVWLDNNIDNNNADCRNTITQLRRAVNTINTFTNSDQCIDFLTDIYSENVCMIITDALCQTIVPLIHDIPQLHTIFVFGRNKIIHEQWIRDWSKVKGIFTEISSICEVLPKVAQQHEQNAISISFVATDDISNKKLDQLNPSFMYTQLLKEILLTIKFDQQHIKEFINYCRHVFADNKGEPVYINKIEREYYDKTPIWWYTCDSFLYSMLNHALRLMDVDVIMKMGFFIGDLHRHIEQLHLEQFYQHHTAASFKVYRGQCMSKSEFDHLAHTKKGLMSFNNFLSTSKSRELSLWFAEGYQNNPDLVGILFIMTVDPSQSRTPFTSITNDVGCLGDAEDEVLFSMHTVFRICEIKPMGENGRLFQVELTLTSDDDKDLRRLTDRIREETFPNSRGWYRLGSVLFKMGQFEKAQQVYEILLEQATTESEKAPIYNNIGEAKRNQGEYQEAITFYEKALEIDKKKLPTNHPNLGNSYENIGIVYHNMGGYSKALSYYEKALEIKQQSLPLNHPDLGGSYNNIGIVYRNMGEYSKALLSYEKALEIRQQSLPPSHPDLGSSYNNIGLVYHNMGEYSKALLYYEKALEIKQQSLPPNHPNLGMSYNNIGTVYYNMGEYSKALSSYEKALEIRQQSLPPNHPDLGKSYNNIGLVYDNMGEYSKALSSYEKALEILQQSLPPNHPDLGSSYSNIGSVYDQMGEHAKALPYFEKVLEIKQQSLPPNHPSLGASYNNIGLVYDNMGEYSKALSSQEKALKIRQQSLPPNHPNLGMSYNNIGMVYSNMGDYSKALSSYEKALKIQQQSLPPSHPDLGASYNNIGAVYYSMGEYSKALSSHEKALEIKQQSLPSNHPKLGTSYNSIGMVYEKMSNYSKALSFYERAVNIGQHSLPSNHPDLQDYKNNLEDVKKKL